VKKLLIIPVAIILVAALIFGGCKPEAEVPEEILLGDAEPITGAMAGVGTGGTFGLRAAIDDINGLGGIYVEEYGKKLPVRLIVVDNESDNAKAATLCEDLILRDDVNFLIGGNKQPPMNASIAIVADRYKVPYVSSSGPLEPLLGLRESVSPAWKYTWLCGFAIGTPAPAGDFRAVPGYTIGDVWFGPLMQYADQTSRKVAVFASDEPDGVGWYAGIPAALEGAGFDVCGEERNLGLVPLGTTDFTPLIREWMDYGCDTLWGIHFAVDFGTMWRQCQMQGFQPKMVFAAKAALFYEDVTAWGGNLPNGVGIELNWRPTYKNSPGIGGTTGQSLVARWTEETGLPLNQATGWGYASGQILFDAIERAGTLDRDTVLQAISETDMQTVSHRVKFQQDIQFSRWPMAFTQWQKAPSPLEWDCPVVYSELDFVPEEADFLFPIPYE